MENLLRRSNPWSEESCGRHDCFPCRGGAGGQCWREGVVATSFGETGRNAYSRGREHLEKLLAKDEDNSVLWLHSVHHHQSREDVNYSMAVVKSYNEPLDRQLMERVKISNFKGEVLMNRRTEMGGVKVERTQYRRWGGGS